MESRKGFKCMMVLSLIFLIVSFIGNLLTLFTLKELTVFNFLSYFLKLGAVICGLLYVFIGCRKNGAKYFSWFVISFTLSLFIVAVKGTPESASVYIGMINKIAVEIMYGCLCILAVAKDLGKTKSYILTSIILICSLIMIIILPKMHEVHILATTDFFLTFSLYLMVTAKYKDKAERGTK